MLSYRKFGILLLVISLFSLRTIPALPRASASGTTLFSDKFDSDPAIAGPVYSWNNPAGATTYEPPRSLSSYANYQDNLAYLYYPGSSNACTQNSNWNNTATPVNSGQGKLSGTYYIAYDVNLGGYGTYNWDAVPSAAFHNYGAGSNPTNGELAVTVSAPNNAISLTVSIPPGFGGATGGYNTINSYRIFITTTSGTEVIGSDYFNVTYANSVSLIIFSLSSASIGTHGTEGRIAQCDPWPPGASLAANGVFVVTSERAHSGSNSLLMGASDLGYDKTSTSIRLLGSAIPYPSLNYVQFSYAVWMSGDINHGTCFNANNSTSSSMLEVVGNALTYRCNQAGTPGVWKNAQTLLGTYYMSTQQWHVISVTFDVSILGGTFYDLTIDGVEPTWVTGGTNPLRGMPAQFSKYLMDSKGNWAFAFWLNTQGITNLSRATAKSNGAYVYIDDISIVLLPHQ